VRRVERPDLTDLRTWGAHERIAVKRTGKERAIPQWRLAFEAADVIFGIDVATGQRFLVFGRAALATNEATEMTDHLRVLEVSIDSISEDLEMLTAACEIYRGHHDYQSEA
jgi:hypothetical protein